MEWMRNIWPRMPFLRMPFLRKKEDRETAEQNQLEHDLWEAHRQWRLAQIRLDEALGVDEVDYAVLTLEAAEKRYGMLLRKAKEHGLERPEWRPANTGKPAKPPHSARPPQGQKEETEWTGGG